MASPLGYLSGSSPLRHGDSTAEEVVVDDLIQGMNEWRNIQEVIRNTFKALHDVIKAQGEAIKSLERQLEQKANKSELSRKANISDVNRSLSEITRAMDSKAEMSDMEGKADWAHVEPCSTPKLVSRI